MKRQFLFVFFIFFCLGIVLADSYSWRDWHVYSFFILSFLSSLFFTKFSNLRYFSSILFFFSMGLILFQISHISEPHYEILDKSTAQFILKSKLNSNEKNRRYIIEIQGIKNFPNKEIFPFRCVASIPKEQIELDFRNNYFSTFYLNRIHSQRKDQDFDYSKYMARKKVFFRAFISEKIEQVGRDLSFSEKIAQIRLEVLEKINRSSLLPDVREFLKGIVLADRTDMSPETLKDFRRSGLAHILAISGFHIGIVFRFFLFILNLLFSGKRRKISVFTSLLLIWVFSGFTDYGNSVIRACIMISVYQASILLQRKPDLPHSLTLSGFIILIVNPEELFDVGFQLGFTAVLGIYWLSKPISGLFPKYEKQHAKFLVDLCSVTVSAQIATSPLVIHYFHNFSLSYFLFGILMIPIFEIIIVFSFLMFSIINIPLFFDYLSDLYNRVISFVLRCIHFFSEIDPLFSEGIHMSSLQTVLLFFCIFFLRDLLIKKQIKSFIPFCLALLVFFSSKILIEFFHI